MKKKIKLKELENIKLPEPDMNVYDEEFWKKVSESMKTLDKRYEEECRKMKIDPISGKSTMTWEERNKEFVI